MSAGRQIRPRAAVRAREDTPVRMMVHRTRKTREEWVRETDVVKVTPAYVPFETGTEPLRTAVMIEFQIASAGGGASRVAVSIPPRDFYWVLEAMFEVDAGATDDAFAWARSVARDRSRGKSGGKEQSADDGEDETA